jgi:hypothetical protein
MAKPRIPQRIPGFRVEIHGAKIHPDMKCSSFETPVWHQLQKLVALDFHTSDLTLQWILARNDIMEVTGQRPVKAKVAKTPVRFNLLLNRNFTVVVKPVMITHQNNFPRNGRTQVSAPSISNARFQVATVTKSNFMSKLQTTTPWFMSTTVATNCQSTTHVITCKSKILCSKGLMIMQHCQPLGLRTFVVASRRPLAGPKACVMHICRFNLQQSRAVPRSLGKTCDTKKTAL